MPQHSPTSKRRRISLRRCAKCDRIGHNARTCIEGKTTAESNVFNTKKPNKKLHNSTKHSLSVSHTEEMEEMLQKRKNTQPNTVVVPVTPGRAPVSPHLVSLRDEVLEKAWKNIEVYHPGKDQKNSRESVDFAELVRAANQSVHEEDKIKKPNVDILKEIARIESRYGGDDEYVIVPKKYLQKTSVQAEQSTNSHDAPVITPIYQPIFFKDRIARVKEKIENSFQIKKFASAMVILSLLATLPFPALGFYHKVEENTAKIIAESSNAFLSLQSSTVAAFNQNLPQAESDLTSALNSFGNARVLVDKEFKALVYILDLLPVVGTKIKARQELLEAGHYVALGNAYLIKGVNEATIKKNGNTIDQLRELRIHIRGALPQYDEAIKRLSAIETTALPSEYQEPFDEFRGLFEGVVKDIKNVSDVIGGLELMLGSEGFKRYLVVFQNQYELRATGGFIGSFATLDVQNGKILKVEVPGGGSYDLQGQLSAYVKPPLPLQLINERWEFQDANWFPDFKTSAEKLAWFYQKSRNTTVDGVIAVNASVLERLLRVIGPIKNEQYDLMLDSETAIKNLSYEIDSYENADGENTPKAVLSVLLEQITGVLGSIKPEQLIVLVTELSDALHEREIQTYFTDSRIQSLARDYGWSGEMIQTEETQDYVMVVHSNIGGGKSDVNIQQLVQHQAVVEDDGSVIATVMITRTHEGKEDPNSLFEQLNSSYVRVYVPEGSELLDAGGFVYPDESSFRVSPQWYTDDPDLSSIERDESIHAGTGTRIVNEFGKTSFGNWMVTEPGSQSRIYFTYRLPFNVFGTEEKVEDQGVVGEYWNRVTSLAREYSGESSRYSLLMQKQSGINTEYESTVIYPDGWSPVWKTDDEIALSRNGASIHGILESDKTFGIVMKQ